LKMVLPERIELSASPLPRECSTPELRQHLGPVSATAARRMQVILEVFTPIIPLSNETACQSIHPVTIIVLFLFFGGVKRIAWFKMALRFSRFV
jgi:hypothetical protein